MKRLRTGTELAAAIRRVTMLGLAAGLLVACEPTIKVEAPKEPITINLNIKLDAEVRIKLERQAEEDVGANSDIF